MVVNGYGQLFLWPILADDILIQEFLDLLWPLQALGADRGALRLVVLQDGVAYCYTLVTDISLGIVAGSGNQLSHHLLAFVTKRTSQCFVRSCPFHCSNLHQPSVPLSGRTAGYLSPGLIMLPLGVLGNRRFHLRAPENLPDLNASR